jgi:predicted Zn-dependent protease with MMP-like domain
MIEVEPERFEDMVAEALDGLPASLGRVMRNVAVTVDTTDRRACSGSTAVFR